MTCINEKHEKSETLLLNRGIITKSGDISTIWKDHNLATPFSDKIYWHEIQMLAFQIRYNKMNSKS